jgi:hypothetical protein
METCTIETGLLRKKPCGQASVTHCATCEQPLCAQHALPQLAAGKKTGKFLCKECEVADKDYAKNQAAMAKHEKEKRDMEAMKAMMNPTPPKKPAAPAPAKAADAKGAPAAADHSADPIEYKPAPKPAAADDIPPTIEYKPEPRKK